MLDFSAFILLLVIAIHTTHDPMDWLDYFMLCAAVLLVALAHL